MRFSGLFFAALRLCGPLTFTRKSPTAQSAFAVLLVVASAAAQSQKTSLMPGMALIPGASFEMGIDSSQIPGLKEQFKVNRDELFEGETPRHRVKVLSFYLDRTEVTNLQFKQFLERNPDWQKDRIAGTYHNGKYLQQWTGNNFPA